MIIISLGIIGMIALVTCYISMLAGKLQPSSYKFLFGNLLGAVCLMLNGFGTPSIRDSLLIVYPILNVIWTGGTLFQIYREWKKRRETS